MLRDCNEAKITWRMLDLENNQDFFTLNFFFPQAFCLLVLADSFGGLGMTRFFKTRSNLSGLSSTRLGSFTAMKHGDAC